MKEKQDLKLEVGQVVDISFESMMGSTGYGWELSELTGPVSLVGITVVPSSTRAVAPVTQNFHIRGLGVGKGKATFILTAPWKVEEPVKTVTYNITVEEAKKVEEDDLKIKGYVASPNASVRDPQCVIPPYAAQPPVPDYGIPCSDLWQRFYYGVLPQQADPRLYYGVNCAPAAQNMSAADPRLYYGVCCSPQAQNLGADDPRVYYGVCCAPTATADMTNMRMYYATYPDPNDVRLYYGICCKPETDECGTSPQVLKYGYLPMPLYNVNSPLMKYNIPPVMRYNFPDRCR